MMAGSMFRDRDCVMKLILTRHGETEENIKGIVQGHMPGRLSATGKDQAKRLAKTILNNCTKHLD